MRVTLIFWFTSLSLISWAQGLINKGAGIVVKSGAHVVVNGNFLNKVGTQDGFVKLDGRFVVKGDVINNATNEIFLNPTSTLGGWLVMPSTSLQKFGGNSTLRVSNLELRGGTKRIDMSEIKVVGVLNLSAVLDLHSHVFHLENTDPASLIYQSGYIIAETTPQEGLGYVRWNVGSGTGIYTIPFGSGSSTTADLNLQLILQDPGNNEGYFLCSTYGTGLGNLPYPTGVTTLDPFSESEVANRFWIVYPVFQNYPKGSLGFQYTNPDIHDMNEKKLVPANYDETQNLWRSYPVLSVDEMNNFLLTNNLDFSTVDHRWTLVSMIENMHVYLPTSFTPNGDGKNDIYKPIIFGDVHAYEFSIFDRWGQMIFTSTDPQEGWDGTFKGEKAPQDVYVVKVKYKNDQDLWVILIDKVLIIR